MATPTFLEPRFSGLEYCIGIAQRLHRNAGGDASLEEFGAIIGNSSKSSHFLLKVNAMRAYGLVTQEKGHIKLTHLGEMVAVPKDEIELAAARLATISQFPPFKSLVERYKGKGEPDRTFIENAFKAEKVAEEKVAAWTDCFIKSARFAGLFTPLTPIEAALSGTKTQTVVLPGATRTSEDEQSDGGLSQKEEQDGWLMYAAPVKGGKARIIVPPDLPHPTWERLKKLLDAIEPEKDDLKDVIKDIRERK